MRLIIATACVIILSGCSSFRWSDYTSPQVSGRVLDATTRDPVPSATVRRVWATRTDGDSNRGAAGLLARDHVLTDAQGQFRLSAVKDVITFSSGGLYGVRLAFSHSEYVTLNTNVSGTNILQDSPKAMPTLDVGDVFLNRTPAR